MAEKRVVIDSSVCIKWFCEEENTAQALALRESHIKCETVLAIPDLALYEIANALRHHKNLEEPDGS